MIELEKLQRAAREARAEMRRRGERPPGVRRRPRDPEKGEMLVRMVEERWRKYPPRVLDDGSLVFPWFSEALGEIARELSEGMK